MVIKRSLNPICRMFFTAWFSLSDRILFRKHHYQGELPPGHQPVLVLCNHISWWDGAWMLLWNERHFFKAFYVLMLAHELAKRPFLRSLGAIGLLRGRQLHQTLAELHSICRKPNALLLIFPQGKIQPAHELPVRFQLGLLKRLPLEDVQLAFAFNAVEYGNKVRLTVFQFVETKRAMPVEAIEKEYAAFVARCRRVIASDIEQLVQQA